MEDAKIELLDYGLKHCNIKFIFIMCLLGIVVMPLNTPTNDSNNWRNFLKLDKHFIDDC